MLTQSHTLKRILIGMIVGFWLSVGSVLTAQDAPRTYYDSLDLSTPEAAVQTFVDAFQRRDYAGVFLIFAPQTQLYWIGQIQRFGEDNVVDPKAADAVREGFTFGFNHTEAEHSPNLDNYLFDEVMLLAEEYDGFLIDLRGVVEIVRSEDTTIPPYGHAEDTDDDETPLPAVNVFTTVEGIDGEVIFRMVQSPSGRWQVLQVIEPGGDESMLPWSANLAAAANTLVTTDRFEGVIFDAAIAAESGLQFEFNDQIDEYGTPTEDQVLALEAGLAPYLQGALPDSDVWGKLDTYRRQYFGLTFDGGDPLIYANYFCSDNFDNWQEAYVSVEDGGDCFFQLFYDPAANLFSDVRVNGEA